MSLYTYHPVVQKNGSVIYLRSEITDANAYDGMPALPRVNSHNDVMRGGSRVPSITQHLLERDALARTMKLQKEAEAAERLKPTSPPEASKSPAYNRVIDID